MIKRLCGALLVVCAAVTLAFGLYPRPLAEAARRSAGAPAGTELRADR